MEKKYIKSFILRDNADSQFDDLIEFENPVLLEDVYKVVNKVKQDLPTEYTNEDIYNALDNLGKYDLTYIGALNIIEY